MLGSGGQDLLGRLIAGNEGPLPLLPAASGCSSYRKWKEPFQHGEGMGWSIRAGVGTLLRKRQERLPAFHFFFKEQEGWSVVGQNPGWGSIVPGVARVKGRPGGLSPEQGTLCRYSCRYTTPGGAQGSPALAVKQRARVVPVMSNPNPTRTTTRHVTKRINSGTVLFLSRHFTPPIK